MLARSDACKRNKMRYCRLKKAISFYNMHTHLTQLFCSSFPPLLFISKYVLRHSPHFYKLVTSKPEEGWFGQPKYCFKYIMLCQPCSSLWLLIVFIFQIWLIRSPLRSNVQSSRIFVHGFAVSDLVCSTLHFRTFPTSSSHNCPSENSTTIELVLSDGKVPLICIVFLFFWEWHPIFPRNVTQSSLQSISCVQGWNSCAVTSYLTCITLRNIWRSRCARPLTKNSFSFFRFSIVEQFYSINFAVDNNLNKASSSSPRIIHESHVLMVKAAYEFNPMPLS